MSNTLTDDEMKALKEKIRETMKAEAVAKLTKVEAEISQWAETSKPKVKH
jgi:hypothetical protein